ncbi:hypothetical protein N4G40_12875 [Pantoea eucrina]|uniref:Uncharacterized protein n=1 Tax=Pantoea eucrina TaxID=472693 RepID=A0ABU5LGT9_9GAMM|nr:hypothetical protein [Pantoea eucrina]MDZ7279152.1 hypothetical protein [Pantoea eucrina]
MLAKIFPCQPAEPGFAQVMVRLRGEDSLLPTLNFTLCNNEQNYLQPNGHWSPAPHVFTVTGGYAFNSGSGFRIGPDLLDPLLANASQVQIQAQLPSGETRSTTLQLVRDELLSSGARGQTAQYGGSSTLRAPAASPEPVVVTEPVISPEPTAAPPAEPVRVAVPTPAKRRTPWMPIVIAVLLVVALAAAAIGWFMLREPAAPAAEPAGAAAKADDRTCSADNLTRQGELDFVQVCVQQKLDSDALLNVIQAAKKAEKCGVAQRLYANRAQGGDSKIALAYAGEYDPQDHTPSACFKTPDADTAVYWYETVLQTDPDNTQAKQRLEALKK